MQNKKSLLQRLLVIYITFFIVLVASIAHGILPNFSRGAAEGAELGNDIAEKWKSGVPRMIYMLGDIRVTGQPETAVEIAAAPGVEIKANVRKLALVVEQNAPGTSPLGLAFRSIGGSAWLYAWLLPLGNGSVSPLQETMQAGGSAVLGSVTVLCGIWSMIWGWQAFCRATHAKGLRSIAVYAGCYVLAAILLAIILQTLRHG